MVLCQLRPNVSEVPPFFVLWSIQLRARFLRRGKVWGLGRVRRTRTRESETWMPTPGLCSICPIWQMNGLVPELLTLLVHLSGVLLFLKQWLWWAGQHWFLLHVWGGSRRACMRFWAGIHPYPISITVSGSSSGTEISLWPGS